MKFCMQSKYKCVVDREMMSPTQRSSLAKQMIKDLKPFLFDPSWTMEQINNKQAPYKRAVWVPVYHVNPWRKTYKPHRGVSSYTTGFQTMNFSDLFYRPNMPTQIYGNGFGFYYPYPDPKTVHPKKASAYHNSANYPKDKLKLIYVGKWHYLPMINQHIRLIAFQVTHWDKSNMFTMTETKTKATAKVKYKPLNLDDETMKIIQQDLFYENTGRTYRGINEAQVVYSQIKWVDMYGMNSYYQINKEDFTKNKIVYIDWQKEYLEEKAAGLKEKGSYMDPNKHKKEKGSSPYLNN